MRVLVLNCGSSSLKFQLIETSRKQIEDNTDRVLARGLAERIGSRDAQISYHVEGEDKQHKTAPMKDFADAIQLAFEHLGDPQSIEAVGHRFVHGGDLFSESALIDDASLKKIESLSALAPLHNPNNLKGYYASRKLLPEARQVAVLTRRFIRHCNRAPIFTASLTSCTSAIGSANTASTGRHFGTSRGVTPNCKKRR